METQTQPLVSPPPNARIRRVLEQRVYCNVCMGYKSNVCMGYKSNALLSSSSLDSLEGCRMVCASSPCTQALLPQECSKKCLPAASRGQAPMPFFPSRQGNNGLVMYVVTTMSCPMCSTTMSCALRAPRMSVSQGAILARPGFRYLA